MKLIISIATSLIIAFPAIAGPGHGHSHGPQRIAKCKTTICTKKEITDAVTSRVIPSFISKKKLAESWATAEVKKVEQKKFKGNLEWRLQFYNKEEADSKKNLFVFVTTKGFLSGINHTGK